MKKLFFILAVISMFSCKNDIGIEKYKITGIVQKGPFIQGSEVRIQQLDGKLTSTGSNFFSETKDDFGSFELNTELPAGFIDVATTGFYFNEITGKLSSASITLRGISYINKSQNLNINILTTLAYDRIKHLIDNDKQSFSIASNTAQKEVLRAFNIVIPDSLMISFDQLDISKSGVTNSILLAISSILQYDNSEAQLSELIKKISDDLKVDGLLNNETYKSIIKENSKKIVVSQVVNNLIKRYTDLGINVSIPSFEDYIDSDGDGILNLYETANPIFNLQEGGYNKDIAVTISSSTSGAKIYYTLDGTNPDTTSTLYVEPIQIKGDFTKITIKAVAKKLGFDFSCISTATYTINYPEILPIFDIPAGTLNFDTQIKLSSNISDAKIYYTTDLSEPTIKSTLYSQPIIISGDGKAFLISAIATKEGYRSERIATTYYKIDYLYNPSIYNSNLTIADYKKYIVGRWIGYRNCEWTSPMNVEVVFKNDGTYTSKSLTPTVYGAAFYYGSDNELNTYAIFNLNSDGSAIGQIGRFSDSNIGGLRFVKFSENYNVVSFEFWHRNTYGPFKYRLTRIE